MNEQEKKKRLEEKQEEKKLAVKMLEEYEAQLEKEDARRAAEWEKREQRIKKQMDRMGDVIKKSNKAEKEFEERLLRDQL